MPLPEPATSHQPPATSEAFAQRVLHAEADAIRNIPLDHRFTEAVELVQRIAAAGGSLVLSGLGKSGLIAQKLSATFSSTGTPSHFLHPVEAVHGDLGRVRRGDAVLLLSFGGNTDEIVSLAELLRLDGVPILAIVGTEPNGLSRNATLTLPVGDITEACPLELAPTSSTTAMLALGDALALAVSRARQFTVNDFQRFHPGGGLGRQLMPVIEAMRFTIEKNLPLIALGTVVEDAYDAAEAFAKQSRLRRPGALLIVDDEGKLAGIVTDGDLRSALIRTGPEVWSGPIDAILTADPTTLSHTALVKDAVRIVREKRFDEIPIIDDDRRPVGLIDVQDLAALKVIEG